MAGEVQLDEILVLEVEKYPVLYDKSNKHYKNKIMKNQLWVEIGAKLNSDAESV